MANLGSDDTPIVGESFGLPSGWALVENADGEIVIEDSGGNVVFRRDETAGEWVTDSIDAGSINTDALEAEKLLSNPTQIVAQLDEDQDIPAGTNTELEWSETARQTNDSVDLSDFEDYANNGFTIPSDPDFNELRLRVSIITADPTTIEQLFIRKNGSSSYFGVGRLEGTITSFRSIRITTDWIEVEAGDSYTTDLRFEDETTVNEQAPTTFSLEVR